MVFLFIQFYHIFQVWKNDVFFCLYLCFFICSGKAPLTISAQEDVKIVYYRALYPFESRSHDEITIQPGDIVMVRTDNRLWYKCLKKYFRFCTCVREINMARFFILFIYFNKFENNILVNTKINRMGHSNFLIMDSFLKFIVL